jgi:large subunit ribosomal protein L23
VKDPYSIIVRPHITEKTVALSHGDPRIRDLEEVIHKYTFIVANTCNKLEVKAAIEAIYNKGKDPKAKDLIEVAAVNTLTVKGKMRRVGQRKPGKRPDTKKAIVTLVKGQVLEDYGV